LGEVQSLTDTLRLDASEMLKMDEAIKIDAEPEPETVAQPTQTTTIIYQAQDIKNPGIAAVLSFLCTGLGQIYNGQIGKGIGLMALQVINVLLMFILIGFITFPLIWLYGVYDAYSTAQTYNQNLKR
jgi:TM2 domain-containing membrane protein YozV